MEAIEMRFESMTGTRQRTCLSRYLPARLSAEPVARDNIEQVLHSG